MRITLEDRTKYGKVSKGDILISREPKGGNIRSTFMIFGDGEEGTDIKIVSLISHLVVGNYRSIEELREDLEEKGSFNNSIVGMLKVCEVIFHQDIELRRIS